jgi:hypothetical protein
VLGVSRRRQPYIPSVPLAAPVADVQVQHG